MGSLLRVLSSPTARRLAIEALLILAAVLGYRCKKK
jgi:hypothetical protein